MLYTQVLINDNWSGSLMYDAGNPELVFCDNLEEAGGEGCRPGVQEGGDRCIPMANSC